MLYLLGSKMLKVYSGNLIGYNQTGISEFGLYGQDTKQVFDINIKSQPENWIYRTKQVFYNRNSKGHRSKEIELLEKDFILFLGCSNTVGSAVALEETFPFIVSKKLNMDYYNLAVEGGGYDLVAHNTFNWFNNIKLIPSMIIIKWPEIARTFRQDNDDIEPLGPWSGIEDIPDIDTQEHWKSYKYVANTDYFYHYSNIIRNTLITLLKFQNIKVIEVEETDWLDYGRDCKHPGIETNALWAESILKNLGQ